MGSDYVLGIDLGTTFSASAVVIDGKPQVIASREGHRTVPSLIAFDVSGNLLIGHAAKRQFIVNPLDTIYGSKRLIGLQYRDNALDFFKKHFNYEIIESTDHKYAVNIARQVMSLPEVASLILTELKEVAQDFLEVKITKAVISVPAYYNNNQRDSIKKAAKIAGLQTLRIVNEPTAAALAYGFKKGMNRKIAVYDFGGGTFDLSVLQVYEEVFEVLGSGGDAFLGGLDIDNRIAAWLIGMFKKENPSVQLDKVSQQRIQDAAEKAKIDLTEGDVTEVNLPFIAITDDGPLNMQQFLRIQDLDNMIDDIIDRTFVIVEKVLRQCRVTADEIEDVILVGGSTRLRAVQKKVGEFFGSPPKKGVHPDEAVALGAAVLGKLLNDADEDVLLVDVLPVSIGLGDSKGQFHIVIPKNTTVPNEIVKTFTTSADLEKGLRLSVYQGEHKNIAKNEKIGDYLFTFNEPESLKGQKKSVDVILRLDANCLLEVTADPNSIRPPDKVVPT